MNSTRQTAYANRLGRARRSLSLLSLSVLLLTLPGLVNGAASASLDRQSIASGDSTTLRITTTGDDAGKQPDLSALRKDFEILSTSTRSQIQIINGQRHDKYEWLIELAPLRDGQISLPALRVGNSKTEALTLQVKEQTPDTTAEAGQPVFMRSQISPAQDAIYVQQQILYTTRLYYRVPLIEGSFTDPKIENAVVERLGEDRQYTTTVDGLNYQVVERRYAIFPEHSGPLHIAPTVFSGRTVSEQNPSSAFGSANSIIEQMLSQNGFNDPFFNNTPFSDPGKRLRLSSNALSLDIKARPAGDTGTHWLPTQKLQIQDSWADAPPVIHAGEPVTRSLTLDAKGLEASQLPELTLQGSKTLQIYPEQAQLSNHTDGDWVYGRSEQRFAYVSSQPGKLHIPAVQIHWWDSLKHKQQTTTLAAYDIMVLPGNGQTTASNTAAGGNTAPADTALPGTHTNTDKSAPSADTHTAPDKALYWALSGGLAVLILLAISVLLMRRQRKAQPNQPASVPPHKTEHAQASETNSNVILKRSRQALRDACTKSEPQAAAVALLEWAGAIWPHQPPRSLGTLAARIEHGAEHVRELESVLYSANQQHWNGLALWKAFSEGLLPSSKRTATQKQVQGAPPLYPDWHKHTG